MTCPQSAPVARSLAMYRDPLTGPIITTTTHDMLTCVGLRRRYSLENDVIVAKIYFALSV